jgi:hypothetical protein
MGDDIRFEFIDSKQNGDYPLVAVRDRAAIELLQMLSPGYPNQRIPRMQMVLLDPRVDIDGVDLGSAGVPAVSGDTIYVARKDVGMFILSLNGDREGFNKIGSAKGRQIEVQVGEHAMRIDCSADVSSAGTVPVYGRLDASYRMERDLEVGRPTREAK